MSKENPQDASGTIAGSHAIPQSVNAETYSYHDYTTDGRPQLIPPLGEDELSSSQGGSDRGQVNSELVSTLTVSASISVPHRGWDERVIAAVGHRFVCRHEDGQLAHYDLRASIDHTQS